MKMEQKQTFTPVTITFETRKEFMDFMYVIDSFHVTEPNSEQKEAMVIARKIADHTSHYIQA